MSSSKNFVQLSLIGDLANLPDPLSEEELIEAFQLLKEGHEEAREKIFLHNARLVKHIAKKYENTGYSTDDLFQVGCIGLLKAINTFDLEKKIKFATYSTTCITNEILMLLRKNKNFKNQISLSQPIHTDMEGEELKMEDVLYDREFEILGDYLKEEEKMILRQCIEKLSEKDKEVIMLFFGFYDDKCYTQKEIADKFQISQSYVSRTIKRILTSLKEKIEQADVKRILPVKKKKIDIFSYFKGFSREEIGIVLNELDEVSKKILDLMNSEVELDFLKGESNIYRNLLITIREKLLEKRRIQNAKMQKEIKEVVQAEVMEEEDMLEPKTIYELDKLKEFTKEEINWAVGTLTEKGKRVISLKYGEDLENPVRSKELTKEDNIYFYSAIIKAIRNRIFKKRNPELDGRRKKRVSSVDNQEIKKMVNSEEVVGTTMSVESVVESLNTREVKSVSKPETITPNSESKTVAPVINDVNVITREDYIKIVECLKNPNFGEILTTVSIKEAVVAILKLGYIDGKYFTTESVANFLAISKQEVLKITKNVMLLYKERMNSLIDTAIEVTTTDEEVKKM